MSLSSPPVRLAAISDLHGYLPTDFPECDVAVIAGDVCPVDDHSPKFQRRWLADTFAPWLASLPAHAVVGVAGNHDLIFQRTEPPFVPDLPWIYLQDELAVVEGLRIWGTPWVPWLAHGWAFQTPRSSGGVFLEKQYAAIPEELDVLVSHGPPRWLADRTSRGAHVGALALRGVLARSRIRALITGHIHEARQTLRDPESGTLVANVSAVREDYEPWDLPVLVIQFAASGSPAVIRSTE